MAAISLLTFTTLFPNAARPNHGIFVARRLEHLVASGEAKAHVIAPVPWRPPFFDYPELGRLDRIPTRCQYHDLAVEHPRYGLIPKVGMNLAPAALYHAAKTSLARLLRAGHRFDLIDAHYFYPDGVAAIRLGEHFGLPVIVTARGSDINLIPQIRTARKMIQQAAAKAAGLVTVCDALKDELVALGVAADKITTLRNGVDLRQFRPDDRMKARLGLGVTRQTLLSVGLLIERKGHHHVIRALRELPGTDLMIAGEGPDLSALKNLAAQLGVAGRVRFLGSLSADALRAAYNAADALVLASSREGWANVLLEAMACGTPVVASAVWGTPEVVRAREAGVLIGERSAKGVANGVKALFADPPSREATRRYAETFSWDATTQGQIALFRSILEARQAQSNKAA